MSDEQCKIIEAGHTRNIEGFPKLTGELLTAKEGRVRRNPDIDIVIDLHEKLIETHAVHIIDSKKTLTVTVEEMRSELIKSRTVDRHPLSGLGTTNEIHTSAKVLRLGSLGDIEFLLGIAGKQNTLPEIRLLLEG